MFPESIGWDNWGELMCDERLFAPIVRAALSASGLPAGEIRAGFPGTNAVFTAGDGYVVKIYAPLGIRDADAERACYRLIRDFRVPLAPRLYAEGALEFGGHTWQYIVMEQVHGRAVREIWSDMDKGARMHAARAVGAFAAAYHALPDPFSPEDALSRSGFLRGARERIAWNANRLFEGGCRESFASELLRRATDALCAKDRGIVLTHSDLTEDHLLIDGEALHIIDFADSRMGFCSLEWVPLWFGMFARDEEAFCAYLDAAGDAYSPEEMLLAAMLHGYGAPILLHSVENLQDMRGADALLPTFPKARQNPI
ncbi:MAG: phosphotransferase family protein [Christensenellales bacterium]|jgi:aminoglycoside phosphotransferase (APT) family kinase protein